ncbi:MAG TPA: hypothetical protein GX717_01645, partial [Clostridiaceae bacterium]|nr:hypothetical protein [Clostridiaceae bacterium]
MKSILIISNIYSQSQHIKRILENYTDRYSVIGIADNSVLGMSIIESSQPDIVIMPTYITFWNAADIINYLLPRGLSPQFVLLQEEHEPNPEGSTLSSVTVTIPSYYPKTAELIEALEASIVQEEENKSELPVNGTYNPAIQHSLEVMELLMGLTPVHTGIAQIEFGRLRVGNEDCWVILGIPKNIEKKSFNFFAQFENLEAIFEALHSFLSPLGKCEVCIYREANLCILLTGGQTKEPDWKIFCESLNHFLAHFGVPELTYEISDFPLPLDRWPYQCRFLIKLREHRFFYSPPFLQPKMIRAYQKHVTQNQIHDKLSAVSLAV